MATIIIIISIFLHHTRKTSFLTAGKVIRAMPELKPSFSIDVFPYIKFAVKILFNPKTVKSQIQPGKVWHEVSEFNAKVFFLHPNVVCAFSFIRNSCCFFFCCHSLTDGTFTFDVFLLPGDWLVADSKNVCSHCHLGYPGHPHLAHPLHSLACDRGRCSHLRLSSQP